MQGHQLTPETEAAMANELGADSLKYLRIEDLAECVDKPAETLCQACVDGNYPTPAGRRLYQLAIENDSRASSGSSGTGRTYDVPTPAASGEAKCQ